VSRLPSNGGLSDRADSAGVFCEWGVLKLDAGRRPGSDQSFRLMYYGNAASGVVFSDTQLYSSDYSLQLSMSLQNFASLRCADKAQAGSSKPAMCTQLADWGAAQRKSIGDLLTFGTPGPNGEPIVNK
jgi:hypothetical protein